MCEQTHRIHTVYEYLIGRTKIHEKVQCTKRKAKFSKETVFFLFLFLFLFDFTQSEQAISFTFLFVNANDDELSFSP